MKLYLWRQYALRLMECNELQSGIWPNSGCVLQCAHFACRCIRAIQVGADLNQRLIAIWTAHIKIHLETGGGTHIIHLRTTPLQLMQHSRSQRVPHIGLARPVKQSHQSGIHGIHFARINLPAALGIRSKIKAAQQKGIFQMRKIAVQRILADRYAA